MTCHMPAKCVESITPLPLDDIIDDGEFNGGDIRK